MQSARDISSECGLHRRATLRRKAPRFTPCRHFGAGSLTDRHVSGACQFCMRQFVHSQDSSWRSLFRNSNFSAQCRIVSASRQICTVPHDLSDRPAYPLPIILPIPLLLKSRKRGRGFNRCIYPSEAVRQRSVRPYDTADTAGKLSTREDLPPAIPATGLIGFIESSNNFSADFPRHLNFRNRRGKRHCIPFRPSKTQQNVISLKMNALTF